MERQEVTHLAKLARIKVNETEASALSDDLSKIVSYVSAIKDIASNESDVLPKVGPVHNIFRKDEVTNQPDEFTADILGQMPKTEGRYMLVKKILNTD